MVVILYINNAYKNNYIICFNNNVITVFIKKLIYQVKYNNNLWYNGCSNSMNGEITINSY